MLLNYVKSFLHRNKEIINSEQYGILDISYITSNVIVMSWPSNQFFSMIYRNNIYSVAKYFNEKFKNNSYMIYNVSGFEFDESVFNFNVNSQFKWKDHFPPSLNELLRLAYAMKCFLNKNNNNVVCVNCVGGKGRSGVATCAFLLLNKVVSNTNEALDLFSIKRFKKVNKGVHYHNQILLVKYVSLLCNNNNIPLNFVSYNIKNVKIEGMFNTNKEYSISYESNYNYKKEPNIYQSNYNNYIFGDVTVYIETTKKMWVCFNTYMIKYQLSLGKECDIDYKIIKGKDNLINIQFNYKCIDPHSLFKNEQYKSTIINVELEEVNLDTIDASYGYKEVNQINNIISSFCIKE